MANTRSTKKTLNLSAPINTSRNHSVPDNSWSIFDDCNSPYYNNALSPLYYRNETDNVAPLWDRDGNKWTLENGAINKNGKSLLSVENNGFEKTVLDTISNAVCYNNGKIFSSRINSGIIEIMSDDTVLGYYNIGNADVLAERIYSVGTRTYYFAIVQTDKTKLLAFVNGTWSFTDITFRGADWSAATDVEFSSPGIMICDKGNTILIGLTNKTGANINANTLYTALYYIQSNALNDITSLNRGAKSTVTIKTDVQCSAGISILQNNTSQTRTCTKSGDKYIDTETGTEVTFSEGYTPVMGSGNTYRYTVYTSTYSYRPYILSSYYADKHKKANFHFVFSLNDVNYPNDVAETSFSRDAEVEMIASGTPLTTIFQLKYTSNFGYVSGKSFATPTITFQVEGDNSIYDLPATAVKADTTALNQPQVETFKFNEPYFTTSEQYDTSFRRFLMLDDGFMYGFSDNSTEAISLNFKNSLAVSGHVASITPVIASAYDSNKSQVYHSDAGCVLNVSQNWVRVLFRRQQVDSEIYAPKEMKYFSTVSKNTENNTLVYFMFDSSTEKYYLFPGIIEQDNLLEGQTYLDRNGVNQDKNDKYFNNTSGARTKDYQFKSLYNAGYISGFSYSDVDREGTLLTGWTSVDTNTFHQISNDLVLFKNAVTNKWTLIKLTNNIGLRVVENRYIVANTTSYYNAWDNKLGKKVHYASDWNDRTYYGLQNVLWVSKEISLKQLISATGENVLYRLSEDTLTSALFPTNIYTFCSEEVEFDGAKNALLEFYQSEAKTGLPTYKYTYHNGSIINNPNYEVSGRKQTYILASTASMILNPSIFTGIIEAGNNIDYMQDDGYSYRLVYDNSVTPILQASSASYLDNMDCIFVVQSMIYGVMGDKIYSLNYLNGTWSGCEAIINIKGMQYVGSIPKAAFFYSPLNRAVYSFTGDANLQKVRDFAKVGKITGTWYNTATQTIYIATDSGLYMMNENTLYRQSFYDIAGVYFSDDGEAYVVNKENGKYVTYIINYEKKDGYQTNKVVLDTGLFGTGDNMVFVIDRWSLSLWNDRKENGTIKIKSQILTDKGTIENEEKTIKVTADMWDKTFNSLLINYVPKLNRGLGVGVIIESDFAISNIIASVTQDMTTQLGKVNI